MAFWGPFLLGAATAAAGFHFYKNRKSICCKEECSCGCIDVCECSSDCDCSCNLLKFKDKVAKKADFALEKVKSGLHSLEGCINEENVDKVKCGLQAVGDKISELQGKIKIQPPQ
ncbi:MAG: hypothetical protein LBU89_05860 [Fibromonadaceae bacterium]|jgi:hypothetical protein|nr:hypothetical protein [Fibromonadaceae bacterium]